MARVGARHGMRDRRQDSGKLLACLMLDGIHQAIFVHVKKGE